MPHSSYETLRGAIEAGTGFDAPTAGSTKTSWAEEIGRLAHENLTLHETVRLLQAELTDCRSREAFLWDALVSLQYVMSDGRQEGPPSRAMAGGMQGNRG